MDTPSRSASPLPPDMPVTPTDEQCNRLPSIKALLEAGEILDREQALLQDRIARSRSLSGSISPPHDLSSYSHAHAHARVHQTNHTPALQEQMRQLRISDSNSSVLMRHPEGPMNRHPHPPRRPPHPPPPSHMLGRSQEFHSMGPPTTPRFQPQFAHHYSQPAPPSPSPQQQDLSIYYNQFPQVGYTFGTPQQAWEYVGAKPLAEETRSLRACAECRRRKVCCNTMPGMSSCERCIKQNIKCTPQPKYERPRKSISSESESGAASKSGPVRSGCRSHEHPHPYARAADHNDGDFTAPRRASLGDEEVLPRTRSKSKFFQTQPIVPIVLELQRSSSLPDIRFPHQLPSYSQPNFERRASFA